MKKIIFFILIVHISCSKQSFDNRIVIQFDNQKYDSVQLVINTGNDNRSTFYGESNDGNNWKFLYPDSLREKITDMSLTIPSVDSISRRIFISIVIDNDTSGTGNYIFGNNKIKLYWTGSDTLQNFRILNPATQKIERKTLIMDNYSIDKDADMELTSSVLGLSKSYGFKKYSESPAVYIDLTNKYSDSQYLIASLYKSINKFDSVDDIENVYQHFSEKNKNSYYGQKIKNYITGLFFQNITLQTCDAGDLELIIQDSTIYNLIIFTASWCGPCHAMIPLTEEIGNDLNKKLDITYVSIDNSLTANNWIKMIQNGEITKRNLMAGDKIKEVKEKYIIQAIPHSILVYPYSMEMKIIDVRKDKDKYELYELLSDH